MTGRGPESAPLLVRVSTGLLVLTAIRLGLGIVGLVAAMLVGDAAIAAIAFSVGACGAPVALTADARAGRARPEDAEPVPADARFASKRRIAATGVFPSTVGVAVLAVVALFFNAVLAAILAGVLAGMAIAGAAAWVRVEALERDLGRRLYSVAGAGRRLYSAPRP